MDQINQKITPFITLPGTTEKAMDFYAETFGGKVTMAKKYTETNDEFGTVAGKIVNGLLQIGDQQIMFMDMAEKYLDKPAWNMSLLVRCETEAEFDAHFAKLRDGGSVMMGPEPIDTDYAHLRKVTWVTDKFGVTWQLIWA